MSTPQVMLMVGTEPETTRALLFCDGACARRRRSISGWGIRASLIGGGHKSTPRPHTFTRRQPYYHQLGQPLEHMLESHGLMFSCDVCGTERMWGRE